MTEQELNAKAETYNWLVQNVVNETRDKAEAAIAVLLDQHGIQNSELMNALVKTMIHCTAIGARAMIRPALRIQNMKK